MAFYSELRPIQVLVVGIITALALTLCSQSLAMDKRSLLVDEEFNRDLTVETGSAEGHFHLLHWTHPQSPLYVKGLSHSQKFQMALESSRQRKSVIASRLPGHHGVSVKSTNGWASSNNSFFSPSSIAQGGYFMKFSIGTPAKTFITWFDTGSDLVWVQCTPCTTCFKEPDPQFSPEHSTTYRPVSCTNGLCRELLKGISENCTETCQYKYRYGDGNTFSIGNFALETVTLTRTSGQTTTVKNFGFGCSHDNEGDWGTAVDGIVGLGGGPLSFSSQLGSIFGHKFSYCLVNYFDTANQTSPLLFGDAAVPKVGIQYTPILISPVIPTFYYIRLKDILVNREALNIPLGTFDLDNKTGEGGIVIDSGTTITCFPDAAYNPLHSKIKALMIEYPGRPKSTDWGLDLCYDLSKVKNPVLPNVTMVFEGFSLDLPQQNSFALVDDNGTTCLAFESTGPGYVFGIFGSHQQQNFQVLYDRGAKRFGFAKVQCDHLTTP